MEYEVDYALVAAGICILLVIGVIVAAIAIIRYFKRNSKVFKEENVRQVGSNSVQHVIRLETPVTQSYLEERPNRPNEICKALLHQIGGNSRVVGVIVEHDPD